LSIIISDEIKINIVNDYISNVQPLSCLCSKYNLSQPTISKILKEYNVPIYTKQQLYSIGLNEDIFSIIDTEEKAYFLGLLLADGCVFYNKRNQNASPKIILQLSTTDSYMVENFHKFLNAQTSLRLDNRADKECISCVVSSFKIARDLNFYGLDNPKWLRPLPIIRYDLVNHMIRGFFDGDGCFTYRLSHPERKVCNSYSGRVALITYEILKNDIIKLLEYIGITHWRTERCNSKIYLEMVDIARKDEIMKFYNFIYNNANIYLSRKKDKFEQYFILNNMI
jgi:intein/homing endonuclease